MKADGIRLGAMTLQEAFTKLFVEFSPSLDAAAVRVVAGPWRDFERKIKAYKTTESMGSALQAFFEPSPEVGMTMHQRLIPESPTHWKVKNRVKVKVPVMSELIRVKIKYLLHREPASEQVTLDVHADFTVLLPPPFGRMVTQVLHGIFDAQVSELRRVFSAAS